MSTFSPTVLTRTDVDALLRACGPSRSGRRNRALLALLHGGGLRLGEALALRPVDVDMETGKVTIVRGKGGKSRTTGIGQTHLAVVREWLAVRPDGPFLLSTLKGGPVGQPYVRALLPRLARRANIDKRVHAHGFRHTFAHELVAEGVLITHVRDLLGHSSLATTDQYLRALGAGPAVEVACSR